MRKAVTLLILWSMTLHCASRLGVMSYLYQQRHSIAYSLGIIAEIPVAMCTGDYDFGKGLVIEEHHPSESTVPPAFFQTQEINLYLSPFSFFETSPHWLTVGNDKAMMTEDNNYPSPPVSIFHPPA